ncbi:MAG TPA: glycosyltransferase [Stellaceae bacterium]
MILAFEMTWTGTTHAPGNSAMLQTVALACPDQRIRVFADPTHLRELQRDPALTGYGHVAFSPIELSPHYRGKTHIVSARRFRQELATIRAGLAAAPRDEDCLILLLSATPTAIFAASLASRFSGSSRRRVGVQVVLHGNLNEIAGWRPRNPLTRAFDLRSALVAPHPELLRFTVLEEGIKDALGALLPAARPRTDVLPLPINTAEIPERPDTTLQAPVRIGFVGQATAAKGIDFFLDVARDFKARFGDRIEFYLVGRAMPGSDIAPFSVLAHPVTTDHLSRAEFVERLAKLHYVFLPFREGYYNLSASGALLDAMTWLKPVIATKLPLVEHVFARFGDLGYMCEGDAGMRRALEEIMTAMDAGRYARQVEGLKRARESRTPEALARDYRAILDRHFGGLLLEPGMPRKAA